MRLGLWLTLLWLLPSCEKSAVSADSAPLPANIAARWDGGSISTDEVRQAAQRLPVALREQFISPNGQREFVQAVLAKRLLAAEARRRGLNETPEVKEQVVELEERLAIQALLAEAERAKGPPTEAALKAYFEAHQREFRSPTKVRVSRVLLRGKGSDKALRARAEAIRARALKKEPLSKLVALGEGPETTQGGDLGWITEATDDETTAALSLRVGDVSRVVDTSSGLSVLVCTEREEARDATFEETRQLVVGRYAPVQQRKVFDELVSRLKEQAHVTFNTAALP